MFDRTPKKLYELERRFEKAVEKWPVEFRGWLYQSFRYVMYSQKRGSKCNSDAKRIELEK